MNITLTSENKKDYLLIESKGTIENKEELFEHSWSIYNEIARHGAKKILINEPDTHFPLDIFPYFDLVKNYIDNFPPDIRQLKIAIVIAKEYKEISASWESLCLSRGLQYFAFTEFTDAEQWLLTGNY
jgi:hypothetical protein